VICEQRPKAQPLLGAVPEQARGQDPASRAGYRAHGLPPATAATHGPSAPTMPRSGPLARRLALRANSALPGR